MSGRRNSSRRGRKSLQLLLLAIFTVIAGVQAVSGAPIAGVSDLQDLIDLGSTGVTIGDKQFYDFSYAKSPVNSLSSPDASDISVQTAPGADIGLEFSFGWFATAGINMDSLIRYKVAVVPPSLDAISAVNLFFNGAAPVPGLATFATVTETVRDLGGNVLGVITTFNDGAGGFPDNNSASLPIVPPLTALQVDKDIQVVAAPVASGGGVATISFVDNTFTQVPIPEPGMLALGSLIGAGLLIRRR